jgi:uncharacterized protein YoxC
MAADNEAIVNALTSGTQTIVEAIGVLTDTVRDLKAAVEDLSASTEAGHNEVAVAINELTEEIKKA